MPLYLIAGAAVLYVAQEFLKGVPTEWGSTSQLPTGTASTVRVLVGVATGIPEQNCQPCSHYWSGSISVDQISLVGFSLVGHHHIHCCDDGSLAGRLAHCYR